MADIRNPAPVRVDTLSRSPVESISGIWKFTRPPGGWHRTRSLPGHLLHLVTRGSYRLRTNGREYTIHTSDLIYYHETEDVEWLGNSETVEFISVGFMAPALAPLPLEQRVFRSSPPIRAAFARLHTASLLPPGLDRTLTGHAALLDILRRIPRWDGQPRSAPEGAGRSWWDLENILRQRRQFRAGLPELCQMAAMSRATLVRACRTATGTSPMQRLRDLRMAEAHGLLHCSTLNVGQVAKYLGYPRIHEFSREFARYYGHPPSQQRVVRPASCRNSLQIHPRRV